MYNSDPSGNYNAWRANATGKNNVNALSALKSDYDENMSLSDAVNLTTKILCKAMDTAEPDPARFEIFVLNKNGTAIQ